MQVCTRCCLHPGAGSAWHQGQWLHLSSAAVQTQPWVRLAQPMGQQEWQPFLQEVSLQELAQVQDPPVEQEQLGSTSNQGDARGPKQWQRGIWAGARFVQSFLYFNWSSSYVGTLSSKRT